MLFLIILLKENWLNLKFFIFIDWQPAHELCVFKKTFRYLVNVIICAYLKNSLRGKYGT